MKELTFSNDWYDEFIKQRNRLEKVPAEVLARALATIHNIARERPGDGFATELKEYIESVG